MMGPNLLPITDWSLDGRKKYLKENRDMITLVIEKALETFGDEIVISKVFRSEDQAVYEILKRFLVPDLNPQKMPSQDISLFTEIKFWIKHKTMGRASTASHDSYFGDAKLETERSFEIEAFVDSIANNLYELNARVAPDMIGYWLQANRKLLDSLVDAEALKDLYWQPDDHGSPAKQTRYKADACFRFLYLYLKIGRFFDEESDIALYEREYLKRGENKPQYTFEGYEGHIEKEKVRRVIMKVIDLFREIQPDCDDCDQILFKPVAKKSLIEQYEINGHLRKIYKGKISRLRAPKALEELEV